MSVQLLLDENVSPPLRTGLLQRMPSMVVWRVGDVGAPALGTLDPELLDWCAEHDFVLVTNDRSSMPTHLTEHLGLGKDCPGIIQLSPKLAMGGTIDEIILIWQLAEREDLANRISYLPI